MPKFKGDATARYTFPLGGAELQGYGQAAYSYTSSTNSELTPDQNAVIGSVPAYGLLDLSVGINKGTFNAELFADERDGQARTDLSFCGVYDFRVRRQPAHVRPSQPRTIGIRFSQTF